MTLHDLSDKQIKDLQRRATKEFVEYTTARAATHIYTSQKVWEKAFSNGLKAGLEFAPKPHVD